MLRVGTGRASFVIRVHNADVTAQVADSVELEGKMYAIAGVRGGPLFDPAAHGRQPGLISTACWRAKSAGTRSSTGHCGS